LAVTENISIPEQEPVALGVDPWRHKASEPPMSRSTFYAEVKAGRIALVKRGRSTLVITSPRDYIASLLAIAA
jgi:hypothetical protein